MLAPSASICGLLLVLNLQLFACFPIMRDTDVDMLKVRQQNVSSWFLLVKMRLVVYGAQMFDGPSSVWNRVDLLSVVLAR